MASFTSFAEDILASARQLDEYFISQNLSPPTFDNNCVSDLPKDISIIRNKLINTTHTLKQLAQGPVDIILQQILSWTDDLSLRAIYELRIAHAVPLDGSASYAEIATKTGVPESMLRRLLRPALANHMFTSPDSGAIAHTACSRLIVTNREFEDAIGTELVELAPAARRTAEAIRRFGETGEPDHTPYALENGMPIFQMFKEQPERGRRLGSAMRYFTKDVGWDLKYLVEGYDWRSLDDPSTTILDVGGGHGAVTIALANATNHMRFVVQDQSATVDQGRKELPEELRGRVEFREHDFFTQQTVKGATVYLMRWILHNWSDESCVKILRELAPAMSANSKIILLEHFISEDPETPFTEKMGIITDMIMLSCFSGAVRNRRDFERLLTAADRRFVLESVTKPEGSLMCIIVISWNP